MDGSAAQLGTQLLFACKYSDVVTVRQVLQLTHKRVDVDTRDVGLTHFADYTALHWAARNGDLKIVQLLLDRGANANARTATGMTPLHVAVAHHSSRGHIDVVAVLLACACADPNATDRDGLAPLHSAVVRDNTVAAQLLLAAGADLEATEKNGSTPLLLACRFCPSLVRLFVDTGANLGASDSDGLGPLHLLLQGATDTAMPRLPSVNAALPRAMEALVARGLEWDAQCDEIVRNAAATSVPDVVHPLRTRALSG